MTKPSSTPPVPKRPKKPEPPLVTFMKSVATQGGKAFVVAICRETIRQLQGEPSPRKKQK